MSKLSHTGQILKYLKEHGSMTNTDMWNRRIEWRDVVDYENLYIVSNDGHVKSKKRTLTINDARGFTNQRHLKELLRKTRLNRTGYEIVDLHNRTVSTHQIHKLVARAFIGEPLPSQTDINHINGITNDNRVENLEWCTRSENMIHAQATGLFKNRGEDSVKSKIDRQQVEEIIKLCEEGKMRQRDIGKIYGISQTQVSRIYNKQNWSYEENKEA